MEAAEQLSETPIDSLQAGDVLGRYQLLCPIARGGMGQVWAARQTGRLGLPKLVAIKTALPLGSASYDTVQRFLFDEAQVAASIDHPNVCKILELGQEGGVLFIAMEWLHGTPVSTLVHMLPQRRFDHRMAAYIVAEACRGLHAAHELCDDDGVPLEVVHRDATPHNLLVTAAGEVKVMDFGIVKSRNQQHQATETGELKGKISYLAPEQVRGKGVDRRADVFTLGCVLYLATTGRGPFAAPDPGTTILRILEGDYPSPAELVADYPPELEAIVARALAKNVEDRYQTADEFRRALEAFLGNYPAVTREELAALLNRHCGVKIEQRRVEIRAAQKLFDSQNGGPASSGTYPAGDIKAWETGTPSVSRVHISSPAPGDPIARVSTPVVPAPTAATAEPSPLRPRRLAFEIGAAALAAVVAIVLVSIVRAFTAEPAVTTPRPPAAAAQARPVPPPAAVATPLAPAAALPEAAASPEKSASDPAQKPRRAVTRSVAKAQAPVPGTPEVRAPAAAEPARPAASPVKNPSSEPSLRPRVRHTIDENDPFGAKP